MGEREGRGRGENEVSPPLPPLYASTQDGPPFSGIASGERLPSTTYAHPGKARVYLKILKLRPYSIQ